MGLLTFYAADLGVDAGFSLYVVGFYLAVYWNISNFIFQNLTNRQQANIGVQSPDIFYGAGSAKGRAAAQSRTIGLCIRNNSHNNSLLRAQPPLRDPRRWANRINRAQPPLYVDSSFYGQPGSI